MSDSNFNGQQCIVQYDDTFANVLWSEIQKSVHFVQNSVKIGRRYERGENNFYLSDML